MKNGLRVEGDGGNEVGKKHGTSSVMVGECEDATG
jgi:hypothetical protein